MLFTIQSTYYLMQKLLKILTWSLIKIVCTKKLGQGYHISWRVPHFYFRFPCRTLVWLGMIKNASNLFGVGKKCSEFESSFAPWLTRPQPLLQSFDWLFLLLSIVSFLSGRPANVCTVVKHIFTIEQLGG